MGKRMRMLINDSEVQRVRGEGERGGDLVIDEQLVNGALMRIHGALDLQHERLAAMYDLKREQNEHATFFEKSCEHLRGADNRTEDQSVPPEESWRSRQRARSQER
jgi:hypothetical protein